jgi:hypothetical protein
MAIDGMTSCARCRATFDARSWPALRIVERLHRDQLADLFTEWPWEIDACLEVRVCRCGETLVRLEQARAERRTRVAGTSPG